MSETKKETEYAIKLQEQIIQVFDSDSENFIDPNELINSDENTTAFIHALANMVPTRIFNKLTNDNKNTLEFNHIANHLVFQFSKIKE